VQTPSPTQRGTVRVNISKTLKALDERLCVSIKYHCEVGGFYFSLFIVLLTVHTVSLTFLTTLVAPNKKAGEKEVGKGNGEGRNLPLT
jgi:hypothetical protein